MLEVKIVGDKALIRSMTRLGDSLPGEMRQAMERVTLFLQRSIQKEKLSGQVLKVRSGRLRSEIHSRVSGTGTDIRGQVGTKVKYAPVHEFGAEIKPKTKSYLRFQIQGQWVTVKSVKIPARPFMGPTFEEKQTKITEMFARALGEAVKKK